MKNKLFTLITVITTFFLSTNNRTVCFSEQNLNRIYVPGVAIIKDGKVVLAKGYGESIIQKKSGCYLIWYRF
jgi:hypothetical protein